MPIKLLRSLRIPPTILRGKEKMPNAKEKANAEKQLAGLMGKLNNPGFIANAPEAVVAGEKEKAEKLKALVEKLTASEAAMQAMKK